MSTIIDYFKDGIACSQSIALVRNLVYHDQLLCLHGEDFTILIGEANVMETWLQATDMKPLFQYLYMQNSKIPLLTNIPVDVRIEPGGIIRDHVVLESGCIVLMGAIINVGAVIGEASMIDMNAVIGSGASIGKGVHVGAGAVIAGQLEPLHDRGVVIEDDVLIGANATVLAGVHIGKGAIVGAGSVVTRDVDCGMVVQGVPASVVKTVQEVHQNVKINSSLR